MPRYPGGWTGPSAGMDGAASPYGPLPGVSG
jgi:hypothetical protein